jgi:hypothetical protein
VKCTVIFAIVEEFRRAEKVIYLTPRKNTFARAKSTRGGARISSLGVVRGQVQGHEGATERLSSNLKKFWL